VSKQYKQSGKRMARIVLAACALSLALGAATAEAGRRTAQPPVETSSVGPVTPEPAAGLAFAVGVGIVARSLRRQTR
jgi:hypothetical protein